MSRKARSGQAGGSRWSLNFSKVEKVNSDCLPPGFQQDFSVVEQNTSKAASRDRRTAKAQLKSKKAWEVAKSPMGGIFMTMFMLWLSGSSVNIFSISITMYSLINPIKAIFNVSSGFKRFEEPNTSLLAQKFVYIFFQLVGFSIALYKAYYLGLLPSAADWSSYLTVKQAEEITSGVFVVSK
uniref:ER membrane protein complex subunit 4 n=1 Tax=Vannella robusta TaxID=1487602 RepID=A0A7S4HY57_9EUKA|mmetsp:Transcript_17483/g.22240  ORF Transcript_17483/g.22240 Transcript_17483/m.22240 type:complete len:182 (+) Transcript_17483:29-574(+)